MLLSYYVNAGGETACEACLLDAGPQIALFATDDRHHARFNGLVSELSEAGLRLMTTWPCVVEAAYLIEPPQRYELLRWWSPSEVRL